MDFIIDRFEENFAVCECFDDEKYINIDLKYIKGKAFEGSIITYKDGFYFVDKEKTEMRKKIISQKFDSIF